MRAALDRGARLKLTLPFAARRHCAWHLMPLLAENTTDFESSVTGGVCSHQSRGSNCIGPAYKLIIRDL